MHKTISVILASKSANYHTSDAAFDSARNYGIYQFATGRMRSIMLTYILYYILYTIPIYCLKVGPKLLECMYRCAKCH